MEFSSKLGSKRLLMKNSSKIYLFLLTCFCKLNFHDSYDILGFLFPMSTFPLRVFQFMNFVLSCLLFLFEPRLLVIFVSQPFLTYISFCSLSVANLSIRVPSRILSRISFSLVFISDTYSSIFLFCILLLCCNSSL